MPPKTVGSISSSSGEQANSQSRQDRPQVTNLLQNSQPSTMATTTQTAGYSGAYQMPDRLQLPPILPSPTAPATSQAMLLYPSKTYLDHDQSPYIVPSSPYAPPGTRAAPSGYFPPQDRPQPIHVAPTSPAVSNIVGRGALPEPLVPRVRAYDEFAESPIRQRQPLSILTPSILGPRESYPTPYSRMALPSSSHGSVSNLSTPTGTTASFPLPGAHAATYSRPPSEVSSNSITQRCSLHIRQQPRAARAGPDGKDRRNVDPPPILQLLMTDFSPDSPTDLAELKSNHYVVHCKLISADSPRRDVTTQTTVSENGIRETSRLLLGTNVASPFFCADDPDIEMMLQHPKSTQTEPEAPPSPSSRFIQSSSRQKTPPSPPQPVPNTLPGSFFIFADLSVRRAGNYRLEFTLMKIDPSALNLPMIHVAASQVFKVVNAKDFDQVHPSTRLVRGLLERGAPFPLKLKKGIREGQRRRNVVVGDEGEGSVEGEGEGSVEAGEEGEGEGDDGS